MDYVSVLFLDLCSFKNFPVQIMCISIYTGISISYIDLQFYFQKEFTNQPNASRLYSGKYYWRPNGKLQIMGYGYGV